MKLMVLPYGVMGQTRHTCIFTCHVHVLLQIDDCKFCLKKISIHFCCHYFVSLLGSMFPGLYRPLIYMCSIYVDSDCCQESMYVT